jgi:hypothetical protein
MNLRNLDDLMGMATIVSHNCYWDVGPPWAFAGAIRYMLRDFLRLLRPQPIGTRMFLILLN